MDKKINKLWNDIGGGYEYINYEDFFIYYNGLHTDGFMKLLQEEGREEEILGGCLRDVEDVMYEEHFKKAARKGLIPFWQINPMYEIFKSIIPKEANKNYIVLDEMKKTYFKIKKTVLKHIMATYGKLEDSEFRLYFDGFMIPMNLGLIPGPSAEFETVPLKLFRNKR